MLMLISLGMSGFAQTLADYTFTTGTDATKWQTLTTTTSLITPGAGDYGVSTVQDIGFSFTFGSEAYTQFSVNADGNLRLGPTVTGTSNYSSPFSSSNAGINAPKINMLGCDGFLSDSGHVYHEVIGTAPNRVCVIEIFTSTYSTTSRNSVLRWQVQLFEGSNDIQIVFAPTAPPILPAVTRQMGMSADANDVILLNANHQATHYNAGQSTTIASGNWPDVNRYYYFAAPVITCPKVTALTATNLTSTSFDLNWTPVGTENDWDLYVSTSPIFPDSNTTPTDYVSGLPEYSLSSLGANTTYYVYVRANCGVGDVSDWSLLAVTTPCNPITTLPYSENFDAYQGASSTSVATNNLPYCWSYNNSGTSTSYSGYPIVYTSATYAASGNNSIRFYTYSTSGTYDDQIAILPQIDPTTYPISNLQLSFDARNQGSYTFTVVVGIIANPADKTTFVPVDTIVTTSNTYANYEFPFSQYTGPDGFIAMMAPQPSTSTYNSGYIDNIVVDVIPTCPKPKNVASSNPTLNSIDLSWTEMGNASSWDIEYGPTGFTQGDGTVESASTNPYTIHGLENSTVYDFYVRANCGGGDVSNYANVHTAGTACAAITTLPFTEDFDAITGYTATSAATTNLPYCWSTINNGTSTSYSGYPIVYTSATLAASGSNLMRFYTYSTSGTYDDQMVVLPEIDPTVYPMNNLQLSFEARNNGTYTFTLYVGVMTDPTDKTTFVPMDTIVTTSNTYAIYEIPFDQYTGTGSYIAMMAPKPTSSTYNTGYVDNLMVDVIPTCPRPKNLTASNPTLTSIDLAWNEMGTATAWEIEYGPMGFTPGTGTIEPAMSNPYTLNGLNHSTGYDFYVRSNCGGSDISYWSAKTTAATSCAPIDNLPYIENFDAYEGYTTTSASTNNLPYCWSKLNAGTSSTYSGYPIIYASATYAASGNNSIRFYTYTTSGTYDDQIAILPEIDVNSYPINTLQISFDARDNATTYPFNLIVGVMSNPADKTTFVPMDTIITSSTSYANYTVLFDTYTGTGSYIALMAKKPTSDYNYGYVDNVAVELIPSCPRPTDFTAASSVTDEVTLSWTDTYASSWDILYGPTGFDPGIEGTLINNVTDNPYTLSGLSVGVYDFYVRANCGGGDFSEWTITPATASPYTYTMGITGSDTVTGCSFIVTDDGGINGDYSNNCQFTLVIFPGEADSVVSVSGTFVGESSIDYLSVYNGTEVDEINLLQKIVSVTSGTLINFGPLSSTSGPLTLLFHSDGSVVKEGFVAQVSCVEAPSCPEPYDVHATDVTNNEATINWSVMDGASTSFNLVIGNYPGFNPDTCTNVITVNTTDYTFTGLNPYTNYYVMVQTDCGGDVSEWTNAFGFRTACDPITTLPFSENFDGTTGASTTSVATSNLPYCWSNINAGTSTSYSGYPIVYASATYAASGANSIRFYTYSTAGTYDDQIAVLPLIDPDLFPVNTLQMSLDARMNSTSYPFTLVVGVLSSPTDKSTFVAIDTINVTSTTYQHYELSFYEYQGSGNYIALMAPQPATGYNQGYVDNIVVEEIPNCPKPINFAVAAIGSNSVELGWTEVGDATEWEIEYGAPGFTPGGTTGTVVTATTNPFTLDNLTPSTTYDIYLRSNCGSEYSPYAFNVITVTTACLPIDSFPYVQSFDSYGTGTGVYPTCWDRLNTYTSSSTNYPYITTTHYDGVGSLYFYAGTSGTYNFAVSPLIDENVPVNTLQTSFMYRAANATSYLIVGVMSNPADASTFTPIDTVKPAAASSWEPFEVSFSQYTGNGHYIAFKNQYNTTTGYGYLDFVTIDLIPTCPRPLNVTTSNATTTSIDLAWTQDGTPYSWTIEYGPAGFTPGTGTEVTANTNPFTVTGLNPSTVYDFYVTADCGGGDVSPTSFACSGATSCAAITALPYIDNFDAYGTGTTTYPLCWGRINTYTSGDRPYVNSTCYAGVGSLYFYGTSGTYNIAITPEFDASISINTLQATFMYRASSATNDRLIVGVMTNPSDASTFVAVDTVYPASSATTWVEKEVVFNGYTGNGHYIAFYNGNPSATCYSYMDNLNINLIPTCPKPQDPTVTDVTANSVTLNWTPTGTETSWEIAYGANGFDPDGTAATIVTANTHPFTVQNLTEATAYEFYVRAVCGGTDYSYWSSTSATATTLCTGTVALPYTEDFEGYPGTVYNDPNGIAPACWTTSSNNATYGAPHITSSGSYHYVNSGTNCMVFTCGAAGSDAYAALPTFNQPLNTLTVNFWRAMESATNGSTLTVGYVTNLGDMDSTFVTVATIPSVTSSNGDTISVDFTGAGIPANGNICFHWNYTTSFYSCCIDDISVTSNGSAPVITDPTVATNAATLVAQTTATLNATITNPDNVTITAKGFQWKATTGGTYTSVTGTGTGNTFTADLTNLTPNTNYTFKAFITFNGTTVEGSEMTFTTLEQGQLTEPSATTLNASAVTQTTATLNGTIANPDNVTITAQGFEWKQASASSYTTVNATGATMASPITGLTANTDYTYRAFVTTAAGTHYGADVTFTTLEEVVEPCNTPTGLTVSAVTDESITVTWDADANVSSWNIQYRPVGGTLSSATSNTNSYTINGLQPETSYQIQVQANCGDGNLSEWSSAVTGTTTVGIDSWLSNSVSLYPNPAKEYVDIRVDGDLNVKTMEVFDVYGKLINTVIVTENPTRINVSGLANGMYFVRVSTEEGMVTKTFVKK